MTFVDIWNWHELLFEVQMIMPPSLCICDAEAKKWTFADCYFVHDPSFPMCIFTLVLFCFFSSEFKVVENSCISSKPKKTAKHHVPVRLYGTCVQ